MPALTSWSRLERYERATRARSLVPIPANMRLVNLWVFLSFFLFFAFFRSHHAPRSHFLTDRTIYSSRQNACFWRQGCALGKFPTTVRGSNPKTFPKLAGIGISQPNPRWRKIDTVTDEDIRVKFHAQIDYRGIIETMLN